MHRRGVGQPCLQSLVFLALLIAAWVASSAQAPLPDAPAPQPDVVADYRPADADPAPQQPFPPQVTARHGASLPGLNSAYVPLPRLCLAQSCSERSTQKDCCQQEPGLFATYLRQNAAQIYSPGSLARLAMHSIADPFNLLTIVGTSAYSVATDPHSPYGPGMTGWGKLSGVALTQDMTGEFFGTFLIPFIDHEYPHYIRMPNASLARRIAHCIYQPFWTVSDTGQPMVNYSNLVGTAADEAVDISYVPYQQVGWGPSAERIATAWATAPIGNFVTEFVPDVARHVNLNIVFVQRIIDRVAVEDGGGVQNMPPP
ncbi:MAG TPA: hypothetical protein VME18_08250 [Acidobacteriaceae bacterium]|nr:hypothetical protein [Acidobacteriaceae bacterium]